jgi:hypothetical protein
MRAEDLLPPHNALDHKEIDMNAKKPTAKKLNKKPAKATTKSVKRNAPRLAKKKIAKKA